MNKIRKSLNTNNRSFSMVSISCSFVARFHQIFFKTAPRIATKIPICHTAIRLKVSIWVLSSTSSDLTPLCPFPNKGPWQFLYVICNFFVIGDKFL